MQILHVCVRFAPRPLKLIMAQQAQGCGVMLLYKDDCQPDMFPAVHQSSRFINADQFKKKLQFCGQSCDVVWLHTSIGNADMIDTVREYLPHALIVWDIHDYVAEAMTPERIALADRIVCPGELMAGHVRRVIGEKGHPQGMPVHVVYNKCPRALDVPDCNERVPDSVVLNSGVDSPGGTVWRDYTGAQDLVHGLDRHLFVYAADVNPELVRHYRFMMQRLPLWLLLQNMSRFEFGWAGAANDRHVIHDCVTNKFWEYLTANVPVITYRSSEMQGIAENLGVGFDYDLRDEQSTNYDFYVNNIKAAKKNGAVFLEDDAGYQGLMQSLVNHAQRQPQASRPQAVSMS